jgi:hypothetical protein
MKYRFIITIDPEFWPTHFAGWHTFDPGVKYKRETEFMQLIDAELRSSRTLIISNLIRIQVIERLIKRKIIVSMPGANKFKNHNNDHRL